MYGYYRKFHCFLKANLLSTVTLLFPSYVKMNTECFIKEVPILMSDQAVVLSELYKSYGITTKVGPISLSVPKGELFGFLGPNGAGKTTTIKMMCGLLEPTSGEASIAGIDIWKNPLDAKAKLAYVPDEPNLYPKLSGWEFLRFIGSVFHLRKEYFEKRSKELVRLFKLDAQADDLIETYSHGMRQKIALCAALIHEPEVMFLDEPTVGLDPASARHLKLLLRQICDKGTTVFLSTHILEIAERMCDRIGILNKGKVIALGTFEELRGSNANASLEEVFLELTGGEDSQELIRMLAEEEDG